MKKRLAFIALVGVSSMASASDIVSIPRVTPYADGVGTVDVRTKCDWNSKISQSIARHAERPVYVTDADVSQASGKVLTMKITLVHAIGGGDVTGYKFAEIHGELHDGGKLVGSFVDKQHTMGGWTACGSLDRLAKDLGEDIADWLKDPTLDAKL